MQSDVHNARREPGLVGWRREQLERTGFPPAVAASVAADTRLDLHALLELVEHGCPPELAVRILAPLEAGGDGT
jgi:hypothetical protein